MEAEGAAATAVPTLHDEFLQTLHDTVRRSQTVFLRAWAKYHTRIKLALMSRTLQLHTRHLQAFA